jgi:outer membrane immunogenic protein
MNRNTISILAAAGLSLALGQAASAADMPARAPVYKGAPAAVAPYYNWTGFYIGGNVGYGWAHARGDFSNGFTTASTSQNLNGVIGGGQIGYNWQFASNWVLGIEGDGQGSGQSKNFSTFLPGVTVTGTNKIDWFATLRGRLGYAADHWLIYFTGGAAWVGLKSDATVTTPGATTLLSLSDSRTGWTVGGGIEWAFAGNWSAKLEYLYIDTGHENATVGAFTDRIRVQDNIFRFGINYRFGGPVVANY